MAGKKKFEELLSRRIMGEQGWEFFCRLCGKYQPEQQFYKKKGGKWGLDSKCKTTCIIGKLLGVSIRV